MATKLNPEIKRKVVNYCNAHIVPDSLYDRARTTFPSQWFVDYFAFLQNPKLEQYLGEAYYQARFIYKLMSALSLPKSKHRGFVKFQIIQYASIYEAILDYSIERYYKEEFSRYTQNKIYTPVQCFAADTKLTFGTENVVPCKIKLVKVNPQFVRIDKKTEFARSKTIISSNTKTKIDTLYDMRNNVHILKASKNDYIPKIRESAEAFGLMDAFISEIKTYFSTHPVPTV